MAESVSRMHINKKFVNEPHVGNAPQKLCFEGEPRAERRARRARKGPRGNPVASSKGTSYFNDALGTKLLPSFSTGFGVPCGSICFALGGGSGSVSGTLTYSWNKTYAFEADQEIEYAYYFWNFDGTLRYSDEFKDPVDIGNWIDFV